MKKFANKVADTLEKQEKLRKEFEKIRKLDAELAHRTQFERDRKNAKMRKQHEEDEARE